MPDFAYSYLVYFCQDKENIAKLECPRLLVSFPSRLTPKGRRMEKKKKKRHKAKLLYISFPSIFLYWMTALSLKFHMKTIPEEKKKGLQSFAVPFQSPLSNTSGLFFFLFFFFNIWDPIVSHRQLQVVA